jgi:hypothetical protein
MIPLAAVDGAPVRDHRNGVRNRSESLAAFNRNKLAAFVGIRIRRHPIVSRHRVPHRMQSRRAVPKPGLLMEQSESTLQDQIATQSEFGSRWLRAPDLNLRSRSAQ